MAELIAVIFVAGVAIAFGLWLFTHLALAVSVVLFVLVVGAAFALLGATLESIGSLVGKRKQRGPPKTVAAESPPPPTLLEALELATASVREAASAELKAASIRSDSDETLLAEVDERKAFVREQRLDDTLCWLVRVAWHYPSWSNREDAREWVRLPLTDISGSAEDAPSQKTILFTYQHLRLCVELTSSSANPDGIPFGDLQLRTQDGEVLLKVGVTRSAMAEYSHWRPISVLAFRPGEWVPSLVALREGARVEEEKRRLDREHGRETLEALRRDFDL